MKIESNSKKPVKLKAINIPKTVELQFYKELKLLENQLKEYVRVNIIPKLKGAEIPITKDSVPELIMSLNMMSLAFSNIIAFSNRVANNLINGLSKASKEKTIQSVKNRIGVDISMIMNEANIKTMEDLQRISTVNLIKSIPEEFIKDIMQTISIGINEGLRHEEIAKQINGIKNISSSFGKLENRVKLIARNESSTINSNLTKARYQNIGIDLYVWDDSGDNAVRPSHKVLSGKICSYSDPTVYADTIEDAQNGKWKKRSSIGGYVGNVGTDYNCRCVPIPIVL